MRDWRQGLAVGGILALAVFLAATLFTVFLVLAAVAFVALPVVRWIHAGKAARQRPVTAAPPPRVIDVEFEVKERPTEPR